MAKGFKGPKMQNQMGMMQQLQKLQEQLEVAQAKLAEETVSASAGGGAVTITVTGDQQCRAVEIDAALLQEGDVEMLQDLLLAALTAPWRNRASWQPSAWVRWLAGCHFKVRFES